MNFVSEITEHAVTERGFTLTVAGDVVPGLIWTPEGATGPRPLLLVGHGGTQHKRVDSVLARGRSFARHLGYAVVAIDAPAHGDRTTPEEAAAAREALTQRIAERVREFSPERAQRSAMLTAKAVPEWIAALDAAQQLPEVGHGPVGWWGVSMGTTTGVPLIAVEPRITAAVLGLNGLRAGQDEFGAQAASIAIPLLFSFQWHDQLVSRESGIALYDAFASREKTMHINPGGHTGTPEFEKENYERFFERHLGRAD